MLCYEDDKTVAHGRSGKRLRRKAGEDLSEELTLELRPHLHPIPPLKGSRPDKV